MRSSSNKWVLMFYANHTEGSGLNMWNQTIHINITQSYVIPSSTHLQLKQNIIKCLEETERNTCKFSTQAPDVSITVHVYVCPGAIKLRIAIYFWTNAKQSHWPLHDIKVRSECRNFLGFRLDFHVQCIISRNTFS